MHAVELRIGEHAYCSKLQKKKNAAMPHIKFYIPLLYSYGDMIRNTCLL